MKDQTTSAPESQAAKKTPVRLYRVNDTLVEASTPAQATHHYAKRTISTRVATQEDIVELLNLGVAIQRAGQAWIESPKRTELKATLTVDPGAADAMVRAAGEAAAVPGATEGDIEGAALAAVRIETEGRTGLRITLAEDEPRVEIPATETATEVWNAGVKGLASALLGIGSDTAAPVASENPAVLGSDDPAVLVTGELPTTAHHPV